MTPIPPESSHPSTPAPSSETPPSLGCGCLFVLGIVWSVLLGAVGFYAGLWLYQPRGGGGGNIHGGGVDLGGPYYGTITGALIGLFLPLAIYFLASRKK